MPMCTPTAVTWAQGPFARAMYGKNLACCINRHHGRRCRGTTHTAVLTRYFVSVWVSIINVMLSPFSKIRPRALRVPFFMSTSSAASRTKFMYSSKPCGTNTYKAAPRNHACERNRTIKRHTAGKCKQHRAWPHTYNDAPFHTDAGLFVQPDLDAGFLDTHG